MPSLLNGLSQMGAGIAAYAGQAGLEAQKADLLKNQTILADSLAGKRESVGRQEAGAIAATAAEKEHGFQTGENVLNRQSALAVAQTGAGATLGAAAISASASRANTAAVIAANAPLVAAQAAQVVSATGLTDIQAEQAKTSMGLTTQILTEVGKPLNEQDQTKLTSLYTQRSQLGMSFEAQAKMVGSLVEAAKTASANVSSLDQRIAIITGQLANINLGDEGSRAAQKLELENLNTQRDAASAQAITANAISNNYIAHVPGLSPPAGAITTTPPAQGARPPLSNFGPASQPPAGNLTIQPPGSLLNGPR